MAKSQQGLSVKVLKVMGLFSGLQVFNMLCSVVKMKLVSLWLKEVGVGLFGIFQNTIDTIGVFTELGLRESSVREVAANADRPSLLARTVHVVRRWSWFSGLLGSVVIIALSPILALYLMGSSAQWWCFALLSAAMLFKSLLNGEQAILQGTGRLRQIARSSFHGTLIGLAVSIPMFRWLGNDSVMLSLIAYALAMFLCVLFVRHKPEKADKPSLKESLQLGRNFVRLGAMMAIAAFVENVSRLIFMGWLQTHSGVGEVGFYNAGYAIIIRYVGMLFSAVMVEFYPRLARSHHSPMRMQVYVSHEISLLLVVLTPVVVAFLLCRNWIVELLYTHEFLIIIPFISWGILGTVFRAVSTCMAVGMLAKGDGKAYVMTETADSIIGLVLNIGCYLAWGLAGLGVAYLLWYAIYCLLTGYVYFIRYGMRLSRRTWLMLLLAITITFSTFFITL